MLHTCALGTQIPSLNLVSLVAKESLWMLKVCNWSLNTTCIYFVYSFNIQIYITFSRHIHLFVLHCTFTYRYKAAGCVCVWYNSFYWMWRNLAWSVNLCTSMQPMLDIQKDCLLCCQRHRKMVIRVTLLVIPTTGISALPSWWHEWRNYIHL